MVGFLWLIPPCFLQGNRALPALEQTHQILNMYVRQDVSGGTVRFLVFEHLSWNRESMAATSIERNANDKKAGR